MSAPQANGFNTTMGAILAFIGLILCIVSLPALISIGFTGVGWLLVCLLGAGSLLIAGGLQMYMQGRNDKKQQEAVLHAVQSGQLQEAIPDVLAHWSIDRDTWNAFCTNEKKYRKEDNLYFFIAFLIIGTIVLLLARNASVLGAIFITALIGGITVAARKKVALKKLQVTPGVPLFVTVGKKHVILNGILYPINTDRMRTGKVRLITDSTPIILEFTLHWPTRKGETFDEFRLPLPPDALSQAHAVLAYFTPASTPTQ